MPSIEWRRRHEASAEKAVLETYLTGVSVRRVEGMIVVDF
jgi:transposase-like protein